MKNSKKNSNTTDIFNILLMVTKLGDIICNTSEEKNDWKVRMMKASLGQGVDFPDDWDSLPEEEKTKRLTGALSVLE